MSYSIKFQGPFIKNMYGSSYASGRGESNPLFGDGFDQVVKTPNRRIYLVIQNQGATDVDITFTDGGSTAFKLYAFQSVSFDNFNAGFTASGEVKVFESFA